MIMKNIFSIKRIETIGLMLSLLICFTLFASCDDDNDSASSPITISKVFLQNAQSTVSDREVTFARLGQLIRIEGSGFSGLRRVYINGYSTYFNPVYVSDNSMLISLSKDTPITEADAEVRNTIRLVKDGTEASFDFEVRASAPTITSFSNSMPAAGETIIVYGTGLLEVNKVVFPGDVVVTTNIISDKEGKFFMVDMPQGVSEEGGAILIECANGGAYSPVYFNFKKGIILDFDGKGSHGSWGSSTGMIKPEDLESTVIGEGNVSRGQYVPHRPARIESFEPAKNRCTEVWTAGNGVDDWRGQLTPYIDPATAVDKVGFQFDVYVPEEWTGTGFLKLCLQNGFNGGEWSGACYNYVPWIVDKKAVPYQTTGWTTVTVPFSKFYKFSEGDFTFEDILVERETASYANFGIYFENSDIKLSNVTGSSADGEIEFPSAKTSVKIYTDNWRVVSLETPKFSDFPEEDEE